MYQKAFVLGGLSAISFSNGFIFGQVTNMINALQKKDEAIVLSEGQISLIATTLTTVCLIGFGLAAVVTDKLGRRWPCSIFSAVVIINWIILYYATEMYAFMLSRIVAGISGGALISLNIMVPSEYTNPNTRAFFLNMVTTVAPAIGNGAAHIIGLVLHWRLMALVGVALAAFGVLLPYFWVESPHWLASKGKFEECETAFRILHGNKQNSERELELLIKIEKSKLKRASESNSKTTEKRLCLAFKRKYFWKLLILSVVINAYFAAAGKHLFSVLATVMLEQITGTSDVLLFTLLVDVFIVVGSCMSCFLIRKTSMRILLFTTGFAAPIVLVLFSVTFYLKNGQVYFDWINVALIAFYFIILNAGPYPTLEAIMSEIFPLELKVYAFFITGVTLIGFLSLAFILFPYTVAAIGYHGLFLTNAVILFLSLGYIWLIIPETKGKTLQEIETYFKTKHFDIDHVLSNDQTKSLI